MLPSVVLKKKREQSVKRYHPWIFSGAIHSIKEPIKEGDLVEVYDYDGNFLAIGHFQPDTICIRILSFKKEPIDVNFFVKKFKLCYDLRKTLFSNFNETNVFRLVHGEGDFLPGLIIDYYNGLLVIQCHSAGMFHLMDIIVEALNIVFNEKNIAIYNKSSSTLPHKYQEVNKIDGFLFNTCQNPIEVKENNIPFLIDFVNGQKTGFFIDQRENRKLLSIYCHNKKVANLFGYTGAFSVYAAINGAKKVITVDSSNKALNLAEKNYQINNLNNIENVEMDVMDFFKANSDNYDIVILDPPAFAKHYIHKQKALIAYKQINSKAMKMLNKGGLLFTFSCSQAISSSDLKQAIYSAAIKENKSLRLLHSLHQPPDHPVNIFHPEGEYLKGFVFQIE